MIYKAFCEVGMPRSAEIRDDLLGRRPEEIRNYLKRHDPPFSKGENYNRFGIVVRETDAEKAKYKDNKDFETFVVLEQEITKNFLISSGISENYRLNAGKIKELGIPTGRGESLCFDGIYHRDEIEDEPIRLAFLKDCYQCAALLAGKIDVPFFTFIPEYLLKELPGNKRKFKKLSEWFNIFYKSYGEPIRMVYAEITNAKLSGE